ncbi:MAG TPA: hypothetical protein VFZ53_02450 [Polyangiaceae bacterium]
MGEREGTFVPKPLYAELFDLGRVWRYRGTDTTTRWEQATAWEDQKSNEVELRCSVEEAHATSTRVTSRLECTPDHVNPFGGSWVADSTGLFLDDGDMAVIDEETSRPKLHLRMPANPKPGDEDPPRSPREAVGGTVIGGTADVRFEPFGRGWCVSEFGERESVRVPAPEYGSELCLVPGLGPVSGSNRETSRQWDPAETHETTYELIETVSLSSRESADTL